MKKRFLTLVLSLLTGISLCAAAVTPRLSPRRVTAGRTVRYVVELPAKPDGKEIRLPKVEGLRWNRSISSEYRSINFKTSYRLTFTFAAAKAGRYTIPGWSIRCDGRETMIAACTFDVEQERSDRGQAASDGSFSGELKIASPRQKFFVGEEIPVEVSLALPVSSGARVSYPELLPSASVLFRNYAAVNPRMPSFDQPVSSEYVRGGVRYQEIVFATAFRATRPEKVSLAGQVTLQIPERRRSSFPDDDDDDFFGGSMMRQFMNSTLTTRFEPYTLKLKPLKEIEVLPVPPPPAGVLDTGLVGDWQGSCRADADALKVGDALTLTLTLTGHGAAELWRAPQLSLPEFRAYPPEFQKSTQPDGAAKLVIRYALIALHEGSFKVSTDFAVFDPLTASYRTIPCRWNGTVKPGERSQSVPLPMIHFSRKDQGAVPEKSEKIQPQEELFYQKRAAGRGVKLPLIRNVLPGIVAALAAAFAVAAGAALWRRRVHLNADLHRLKNASVGRHKLLHSLSQSQKDPEAFAEIVRSQGLPALIKARKLPPGTTLEEAVAAIPDETVKALLLATGESGFCPGAARHTLSAAEMKKLLSFFKKLFVILAFCANFRAGGVETDLNAAFDRGDYRAAIKRYETLLDTGAPSPALLYNLGNAYCRQGNWAMGRYLLLQAHLLAPRDTEILENLNWVNRRLRLEETGRASSPQLWFRYFRDRLRPDEYLLLAAVLLALGTAFVSLPLSKGVRIWGAAAAIFCVLLTLGLLFSETSGPYDPRNAVVTAPQLALRSLPVAGGGRVTATIPGGADAVIEETRGSWLRLKVNGRTGWAPKEEVSVLLPQGLW